jgi:ectoine hydroxylase-related dioxygenase (phytanoyl-CoA dioxygenase family)
MKKIIYNIEKYPFKETISKLLECNNLCKIHEEKNFDELIKQSVDNTHKFQQSDYHQKYYSNFELVKSVYENLLLEVVKPIYNNEKIVYQSIPTFRLHFPNGLAVGMFHKDKDLRDYNWHESIKEDNYYLPFIDSYDSNTIWVESEEDKGDFLPMNCKYGQFIQWDGTNLTHGNKINMTEDTRISIDFRVTKESYFYNNNKKSKNDKTDFVIGGYYNII